MKNETVFETANRICQKEINIFLDPYAIKRKRGKIKNVSLGQRMKAFKKWMNVLHKEYVKKHEIPCAVKPCVDCCHIVPVIRSRTEFEYLKKALDMNPTAQLLGDANASSMFKEWSQFCQSTGINPNNPFLRHADMLEWMEYKIPCPFYSVAFGECMVKDTKPIDCRFGRNLACPSLALKKPIYLTPWEIVSMNLDTKVTVVEAYLKINLYIELFEHDSSSTWADSVNTTMARVDAGMFSDKPKFKRQPIYTLFKFSP